uniref:carbonic anhydrase n=1 Tax=Thaumasiovibrio occultus TaxID=1891184 RepID=UPI000B3575E3|nr:carbonic anhydrase family protein [Thaumasiovibrio occultus]
MKRKVLATALIAALPYISHAAEWGYGEENGPDHWGHFAEVCASGKNQSPVDIQNAAASDLDDLELSYHGQVVDILNNGHTLQGGVEGHNVLTIDDTEFELKQFHFHTPSENLINNQSYPLEAHFVHADQNGNLAVVAVMYEVDDKNNQVAQLSQSLPTAGETTALDQPFAVKSMLPEFDGYYRFSGSLTTPPCSEGVRWLVLNNSQHLSQEQADALHQVMGDNNRPVQDIYARQILLSQ